MPTWTKETALEELDLLIGQIGSLLNQQRFGAEHTRWNARTLDLLEEVFGRNSRYYRSFASLSWTYKGSILIENRYKIESTRERVNQDAYIRSLDAAKGLLLGARDKLIRADIASVFDGKDSPQESSVIVRLINLSERTLRKTIRTSPSNERDVQDAFENLLLTGDFEYSREKETVEYSTKSYIPDFTMKKIDLAIEIKLCNREHREKEIISEISDDINAYRTKYGSLLFIVYDLGFIRDVHRFRESFQINENVVVIVVKQ